MLDAHIHLDQYDRESLSKQIEEWREAGINGVIAVSTDLASSYKTLELQNSYPDFVYPAVGFHPEYALPNEQDFIEWESLLVLERNRIVAMGELGLPHYALNSLPHSLEEAIAFLERCITLAKGHNLPVALHAVHDKAAVVLKLLQKHEIKQAHFHWLKAPEAVVKDIVKAGYYVSITPEVCYRRRDQELAKLIPLEQLLIETDGPWSYAGEFTNLPTTPLFLKSVSDALAQVKQISLADVMTSTVANTKRCYRL